MLNKLIREVKNRGLFVNVLLATVVICSWCGDAAGQPGAEVKSMDNAEQFALLCRIYNLAKNPPIHHVDLQDHVKIVEEIDTINSSFSESKLLNETEMTVNASLTALKPTTTREAAVAQAILRRISQKAHNILDDIRRLNTTSAIENVKAVFAQVIFGGGGNESDLDKSTLSEVKGRADACGKSGLQSKGQSAGKNLVVDFFCLCAQNSDKNNGIENVCGVKVGSKDDNHSWGANTVLGSPSLWASIKKGCGNLFHRYPNSTKEGHEVLGDFLTHLKSGGVYRWG
ncbi:unnamed protein product [Trypanosoma congolense IL3000]|nr:unnamed protein product [Trypanosoma congolense IL3000]